MSEAFVSTRGQDVLRFSGYYGFLSNFRLLQKPLIYEGIAYPTSEHAFQAAKSLDPKVRKRVAAASSPAEAKRMGRALKKRSDWDQVRVSVMAAILAIKFQDPELRRKLIVTGSAILEEGNTWNDTYWGICNGVGENMLGKLLMQLRKKLWLQGETT